MKLVSISTVPRGWVRGSQAGLRRRLLALCSAVGVSSAVLFVTASPTEDPPILWLRVEGVPPRYALLTEQARIRREVAAYFTGLAITKGF